MTAPRPERAGLYYPKLPTTWWLKNPRYFRFMIREVTSVFIAIFLVVLLGTIGCFQLYDQVKIATNGGPNDATTTVTYLLWREGFRDLNMGYASALGILLFIGIFAVSLVQRRFLDVRPDY